MIILYSLNIKIGVICAISGFDFAQNGASAKTLHYAKQTQISNDRKARKFLSTKN